MSVSVKWDIGMKDYESGNRAWSSNPMVVLALDAAASDDIAR